MARRHISSGSPFERQAGYSRALVAEPWCFVSGTTGYDYASMVMPETVEEQARNCLTTIDAALADAGFARADIVRARYIITKADYADRVFPILGTYFADIAPAATMMVAGLVRPEMKIEIEVTAFRSPSA